MLEVTEIMKLVVASFGVYAAGFAAGKAAAWIRGIGTAA